MADALLKQLRSFKIVEGELERLLWKANSDVVVEMEMFNGMLPLPIHIANGRALVPKRSVRGIPVLPHMHVTMNDRIGGCRPRHDYPSC